MRIGRSEPVYNLLGAMIIFHACVQFATITLSLLKIQLDFPLPQSILLGSLAAGYLFWRGGRTAGKDAGDRLKPLNWPPDVILLSAAITFVLLCVVGYFSDDLAWDGNYYHLPAIYFWSEKGYVHWVNDALPHSMFINGFPKAVELTAYIVTHALRSDAIVNAVNMLFHPLGMLGLACLARALGASRRMAYFAAAAWILIPINIFQATTLYIDGSVASCVIAMLAAMVYVLLDFSRSSFRGNFRSIFVFGAAGGLLMGSKSTGIMFAGLGLLTLAFCLAWRWIRSREGGFFTVVIAPLLFAAGIIAAVGGYWNMRNYYYKGSPFYPAGLAIADHCIFPGLKVDQFVQSEANTTPELRGRPVYERILKEWFQRWGWREDFFWSDTRVGGLGYFWPAACLPAILGFPLYLIYKRRWDTLGIFLPVLAVTGTAFLIQPVNWWSRFTVWIYALGLPSFTALASVFYASGDRPAAEDEDPADGNKNLSQNLKLQSQQRIGTANLRQFSPHPSPLPKGEGTFVTGSKCISRKKMLGTKMLASTVNLWVSTCILILVLEGWVCCFWACTWVKFPSPNAIKDSMHTRFVGNTALWSGLRGTAFDEIFAGKCPLALNYLYAHPNTNYSIILGGLSTANGKRKIVMVGKNPDKKTIDNLIAEGVPYLIWDSADPLPEVLKQYDFPVEKAEVFYVVRLTPGGKAKDTGNAEKSNH
jgi:hypothetical protein